MFVVVVHGELVVDEVDYHVIMSEGMDKWDSSRSSLPSRVASAPMNLAYVGLVSS